LMIPIADDSDSQVAWPSNGARGTQDSSVSPNPNNELDQKVVSRKSRLTTWNLITLSISMAGAQIAWTVELGYGNPFLLSLGLPEQLTSLVWLAGPISGLIAQPLIGAVSDSSTSRYRRRFWIITATVLLVISTFVLAYCEDIAMGLVDIFGADNGDSGENRKRQINHTAIGLAIAMFYALDFALNALQASLRNLLLDITPPAQLNSGNAWHGRMTHAGNIIGYGFGFLPLAKLPIIRLISGNQFRKFCVICIIILVITVVITCYCHEEKEGVKPTNQPSGGSGQLREMMHNIYIAATNLPKPIRRVCFVQLFAFMGWFPFLFYATTYVGQVMAKEQNGEPDAELATRTGEFAMLLYSITAVVAGTVLPHLANRDRHLTAHLEDENNEDAELARLRQMVHTWKAEAVQKGQPLKLPVLPFLLRNIWTGALGFFSFLMFTTFFVNTVAQATVVICIVGVCWAVAVWAPFAIIMELLKENPAKPPPARPNHIRAISIPAQLDQPGRVRQANERQPLLRRRSFDQIDAGHDEGSEKAKMAGGTVLGIHNLAIVLPQFIVSLASSVIFKMVDGAKVGDTENTYFGKNGVAWVLRFGGLCALSGALFARMVPPTPTEKIMRRRLAEMRILRDSITSP